MRILFMGTPDIAAESLNALIAAGHDICAVFTRADKPVGRKQILTAPPVKQTAEANGIPVYQPRTLRDGSSDELIKSLAPILLSLLLTAALFRRSFCMWPNMAASTCMSRCYPSTVVLPLSNGLC